MIIAKALKLLIVAEGVGVGSYQVNINLLSKRMMVNVVFANNVRTVTVVVTPIVTDNAIIP